MHMQLEMKNILMILLILMACFCHSWLVIITKEHPEMAVSCPRDSQRFDREDAQKFYYPLMIKAKVQLTRLFSQICLVEKRHFLCSII